MTHTLGVLLSETVLDVLGFALNLNILPLDLTERNSFSDAFIVSPCEMKIFSQLFMLFFIVSILSLINLLKAMY